MQRQLLTLNALLVDSLQNLLGEVQTGSRRSHRALDLRIDGLVGALVTLLRLPVKIRWNGQFAHYIDDFGKRDVAIVPLKADNLARAMLAQTGGLQAARLVVDDDFPCQRALFPLLLIANETQPLTVFPRLEHQLVVCRLEGLQQEDFYQGASIFAEMQTRLDDLRVVEHHQGAFWQVVGQVEEHVLPHYTFIIYKQFRVVALLQRKLGNTLVWQWVVIVVNLNLLRFHAAKVVKSYEIPK